MQLSDTILTLDASTDLAERNHVLRPGDVMRIVGPSGEELGRLTFRKDERRNAVLVRVLAPRRSVDGMFVKVKGRKA